MMELVSQTGPGRVPSRKCQTGREGLREQDREKSNRESKCNREREERRERE